MTFANYIVPFDFSENAVTAARFAASLAAARGGAVILAHGVPLPGMTQPNPAISVEELTGSVTGHIEKRLDEMLEVIGAKGSSVVRNESPENWLNDFARSVPSPLIVLSRHGWSGKQDGIGSTAKRILRGSLVPVLVVGHGGMPQKALAALETDPFGVKIASAAKDLATAAGGSYRLAHVRDPRLETGYLSEIGWPPAVNVFDELRREAENYLKETARKLGDPAPTAVVLSGSPAPTLVQEANDWGADIIVCGKHAKGAMERIFLGSTTEAIVRHWQKHVLVLMS